MRFTRECQPEQRKRTVPWETVVAVRRDWAAALAAIDMTPDDGRQWHVHGSWLRDAGQPTQRDLATRYGLSPPLVNGIVKGNAYEYPPAEATAVQRERQRTAALRRYAALRAAEGAVS